MSIFHCSMKAISRSSGRTASGSSAYRAGEKIRGINGEVHDYTKKKGVLYTEIVLPESAPDWAKNRETLWNAVDSAEVRRNSTVSREYELALPAIISNEAREELSRNFAKYIVNEYGVAADIAIHAPREDNNNYHAHIMTSTRVLEPEGFGGKTRILDDKKTGREEVKKIREEWERQHNEAVLKHGGIVGLMNRVSCKSLKEQGEEREPQIHLGVAAAAMERRGIQTERGDYNREIGEHEKAKRELWRLKLDARIREAQQAEEAEKRKKESEVAAASPATHQKPQETQELVRSVSPTVETMKLIRASEPTRDVPEAKKPIAPAMPSMTVAEAEKIINNAAEKIAEPELERHEKDYGAKIQKAQEDRKQEVRIIDEYNKDYFGGYGGPPKHWYETKKVYEERKREWLEERNEHFRRRDKAEETIKILENESNTAKKKIHKQAMDCAAKENPGAVAVIERQNEQVRLAREATEAMVDAAYRELKAAEPVIKKPMKQSVRSQGMER